MTERQDGVVQRLILVGVILLLFAIATVPIYMARRRQAVIVETEQVAQQASLLTQARQDAREARHAARQAAASAEATWEVAYEAAYDDLESDFTPFTDLVQESIKGVVHLQAPMWQGSGFVIGPRLIGTAKHCVTDTEDFLITTHDGHQLRATRAISDKEHDVAFIFIDDLTCIAEERGTLAHEVILTPVPLGSIKDCVLGQSIYMIGSPFGKINFNSLTTGIISGVNRDWSFVGDSYGWKVAFTVDSAGHPGNSGCPVFTTDGVVRGILVGGFSPVLISVMPCDLFLDNLNAIRMMFITDRYEKKEAQEWIEDYYTYSVDDDTGEMER